MVTPWLELLLLLVLQPQLSPQLFSSNQYSMVPNINHQSLPLFPQSLLLLLPFQYGVNKDQVTMSPRLQLLLLLPQQLMVLPSLLHKTDIGTSCKPMLSKELQPSEEEVVPSELDHADGTLDTSTSHLLQVSHTALIPSTMLTTLLLLTSISGLTTQLSRLLQHSLLLLLLDFSSDE
jgi:hypothetical protein